MTSGMSGRDANDSGGDVLFFLEVLEVEEPDDCCLVFFGKTGEADDDGNAPNLRNAAIEITFDRNFLVLLLVTSSSSLW
jgi:hypothetical protein